MKTFLAALCGAILYSYSALSLEMKYRPYHTDTAPPIIFVTVPVGAILGVLTAVVLGCKVNSRFVTGLTCGSVSAILGGLFVLSFRDVLSQNQNVKYALAENGLPLVWFPLLLIYSVWLVWNSPEARIKMKGQ